MDPQGSEQVRTLREHVTGWAEFAPHSFKVFVLFAVRFDPLRWLMDSSLLGLDHKVECFQLM